MRLRVRQPSRGPSGNVAGRVAVGPRADAKDGRERHGEYRLNREFVADRGAALTTGRPSALASALVKLSEGMGRVPQRDLRAVGELNAFFIVPARAKGTLRSLLSTHPPMQRRIAALARLEAQLDRPATTAAA